MKILHYGIVLLFMVTMWGCSQGNSDAPVTIDPTTNKHPLGWAVNGTGGTHPLAYFNAPTSCQSCHGLPSDPAGGISGVSCSNPGRSGVACHPSFPHSPGFAQFSRHGSAAKDTASGVTGMAHCKQCHGGDYNGSGLAPSCIKCHNGSNASNHAPHAANWVSGNVNGLKHSSTDVSNASACYQCHAGGAYSHPAPVPAPPGTTPGCYNGTMCHNDAGHTFTVAGHMIPARSNLASCQPCHATPTSGLNPSYTVQLNATLTPNGCERCHYVVSGTPSGLAHPYMWLPGRGGSSTTSHANAGTVNVSCGLCHGGTALAGGGSAPSCFSNPMSINGTTCHFTKPVDAQGITVGCVSCHGSPPNGTVAPNRAYRHTGHFSTTNNLAGLTCSACHFHLGSGTTNHSISPIPAVTPVAIDPIFNGNGLVAAYNSTTKQCSNVSCHGLFTNSLGVPLPVNPFPAWNNTTTVLNLSNCVLCHSVSTHVQSLPATVPNVPYIGPFSGKAFSGYSNAHRAHMAIKGQSSTTCLMCHNISPTTHWANIMQGNRVLAKGFAAGTVGGGSTLILNYTVSTGGCLTGTGTGCHGSPSSPEYTWY
jgi:predicted CxxxxCH...CXXCH cytochrome family protein